MSIKSLTQTYREFFKLSYCVENGFVLNPRHRSNRRACEASWRSGDAEDCKSLYPGSIPGEASKKFSTI